MTMVKPTCVTNRITELGAQVGVTRQTINAIERAKYSPSLEVAFKIARALDVSLDAAFQYPDHGGPA